MNAISVHEIPKSLQKRSVSQGLGKKPQVRENITEALERPEGTYPRLFKRDCRSEMMSHGVLGRKRKEKMVLTQDVLAPQGRFERPTPALGERCSVP